MEIWCRDEFSGSWPFPLTKVDLPKGDHYFIWEEDKLSLFWQGKRLCFDFLEEKIKFRVRNLSSKSELLYRALKLKKDEFLLDLSAGNGIDSFIIANFGFKVLMLERNWIIYLLLNDALRRVKKDKRFMKINLNLEYAEAEDFLIKSENFYPVIYFDPMFPLKDKSALSQWKMRLFSDLVGKDSDSKKVAQLAYTKTHRLVIKRPRLAPLLLDNLHKSYYGKSHRFDIYLNNF